MAFRKPKPKPAVRAKPAPAVKVKALVGVEDPAPVSLTALRRQGRR